MSTQYIAILVMVLTPILEKLGVSVGSEALTTTATVLVTVGAGLYAAFKRFQQGDIKWYGARK